MSVMSEERRERRKETFVRVPIDLLEEVRKKLPELRDESNAAIVRISLNKLLRR